MTYFYKISLKKPKLAKSCCNIHKQLQHSSCNRVLFPVSGIQTGSLCPYLIEKAASPCDFNQPKATFSFFSSLLGCFLPIQGSSVKNKLFNSSSTFIFHIRASSLPCYCIYFWPRCDSAGWLEAWDNKIPPLPRVVCERQPLIRLDSSAHLRNLHTIARWVIAERDAPAM